MKRTLTVLFASIVLLAGPAAAQPEQSTVFVDGHPLAVWSKRPSSAPKGAILLIHGATWSSLPNWDLRVPGEERSVMDALVRAGYAAYALDQRGYGATPRDESGWQTPTRAVADVAEVLRWIAGRENGARPAVLGYSLGAYVTLLTAQTHPELLSAIVLYASPVDPDNPLQTAETPSAPPRRPTTAEAAASDFITPGAASRAVVDAYVRQAVATTPVKPDWRNLGEFAFDLPSIHVPTLLIHGVHDPIATVARQAKLFALLGTEDRAWVVLPASDHAAHVETAHAQWVHTVVGFLEQPR
jgi:alpha-beta hydrolase superfamily lysophospholipase